MIVTAEEPGGSIASKSKKFGQNQNFCTASRKHWDETNFFLCTENELHQWFSTFLLASTV